VVVTHPAKRAALAPICKRSWDLYLPMPISVPNLHFDDPLHEAQQPRVAASATYLAEHIAEVPALVIPCISPRVDGAAAVDPGLPPMPSIAGTDQWSPGTTAGHGCRRAHRRPQGHRPSGVSMTPRLSVQRMWLLSAREMGCW
jgi:hypothetical protein